MRLSMYSSLFSVYFSLNSEGFANILKTKNQMTYIVVQDGMILLYQQFDAIFSTLGLLIAEIQVIL